MKLQRPHAILFDWDNTLVNSWPSIHAAFNHMQEAMGHPLWSLEETMNNAKHSMRDAFPLMFGEKWEEAAALYQASFLSLHLNNLEALAGAVDTLEHLKNSDVFVGIVSNKKGPTLRKEITHLGWEGYFQSTVGAQDAQRDKPDPAPVHLALENAQLPDDAHIWFIGDSIVDIECAHNTGCAGILYGPNTHHVDIAYAHHAPDQANLLRLLQEHLA